MTIIFLTFALSTGVAEAGVTVTPLSAPIGHRHYADCSHKPHPHPNGEWVWEPGKIYTYVKWRRLRHYQAPGKWNFVPHEN